MAGRPAGRAGGGQMYGVVISVMLIVLSLGAFVWQLTINKRIQEDADRAARRLKEYGTPPGYYSQEATARTSDAFSVMNSDIRSVSELVVGNPEAVRPVIVVEARTLLKEAADAHKGVVNENDNLIQALRKLNKALVDNKALQAKLQSEVEKQQADNEASVNGLKAARDQYESQVAALREDVQRLEKDKTEQLEAKDKQLGEIQAAATAQGEELQRMRADTANKDRETGLIIEKLTNTNRDLQGKIASSRQGGFRVDDILRKADGKVLRAIPGSGIVYANLGAKDGVKPGMTFSVFSPTGERGEDYRGKGSIEIATVLEETCECRVARATPGRPILEGDILVNVAYERGRKPKFVVIGQFDLNHDGETDFDGPERIVAIIREWGGQVVAEVDESTDFVVAGTAPTPPATRTGAPAGGNVVDEMRATRERERAAYDATIEKARARFIPVMGQSQFMFLTGSANEGSLALK